MAKEAFNNSLPHVNIGTIGHVDHGKTTLTAAITKVLADKGEQNLKITQISITLQKKNVELQLILHVEYKTEKDTTHVDCGLPIMLKTWLLLKWMGLSWCAATDGPMPQTREHILLSRCWSSKIVVF